MRRSVSESSVSLDLPTQPERQGAGSFRLLQEPACWVRESDAFRHVFETVLQRFITEGLVEGEGFAIDASIIKADANRTRGRAGNDAVDWNAPNLATRAAREYLAGLEENGAPVTALASISMTDPGARWTAEHGGPASYAYAGR